MDTLSVVRDFEAVRVALGGEKLNFLGGQATEAMKTYLIDGKIPAQNTVVDS